MSFTPGPWGVNKYGGIGAGQHFLSPIIVDSTCNPFNGFYAFDGEGDLPREEIAANVALMIAAPDLLAACQELMKRLAFFEQREGCNNEDCFGQAALKMGKAAIEKAGL